MQKFDQEKTICPVCGSSSYSLFFESGQWTVVRCNDCEMVYLQDPPDYVELVRNYGWKESFLKRQNKRHRHRPVRNLLKKIHRPIKKVRKKNRLADLIRFSNMKGKVIDLGSGNGRRVIEALPLSVEPYGIEIEESSACRCDKAFRERGGACWAMPVMEKLPQMEPQEMNGAILSSYLEHEAHPVQVLDALARVLGDDAPVIIKVPNHASLNRVFCGRKWCGYRFPDHVNYFTPETLGKLLNKCGFQVFRCNFWDRFPFSDNLWMIARKKAAGDGETV